MNEKTYNAAYKIACRDFASAGDASRNMKRTLQQIGIDNKVIRRVSIATYEAEMNISIHSLGGEIIFSVDNKNIYIESVDRGPGIKDIELAMTEGYSTASNEIREMGFGAGMGLPNMKACSDEFAISSKVNEGTKIKMTFMIRR